MLNSGFKTQNQMPPWVYDRKSELNEVQLEQYNLSVFNLLRTQKKPSYFLKYDGQNFTKSYPSDHSSSESSQEDNDLLGQDQALDTQTHIGNSHLSNFINYSQNVDFQVDSKYL